MEILILLAVCASNVACFFIGAKIGQKAYNGERIELPAPDPVKPVIDSQAQKEAEMKLNRLNILLRNIDNYDGTGRGQEDVPRG